MRAYIGQDSPLWSQRNSIYEMSRLPTSYERGHQGVRLIPNDAVAALTDTASFSILRLLCKAKNRSWEYFPLIPLKQILRVHLVRHVRELVAPAIDDEHVAAGLGGLQVVGHLGPEELRRVQRGLVHHHGHALCLHALHDALDGARADVVIASKMLVSGWRTSVRLAKNGLRPRI